MIVTLQKCCRKSCHHVKNFFLYVSGNIKISFKSTLVVRKTRRSYVVPWNIIIGQEPYLNILDYFKTYVWLKPLNLFESFRLVLMWDLEGMKRNWISRWTKAHTSVVVWSRQAMKIGFFFIVLNLVMLLGSKSLVFESNIIA